MVSNLIKSWFKFRRSAMHERGEIMSSLHLHTPFSIHPWQNARAASYDFDGMHQEIGTDHSGEGNEGEQGKKILLGKQNTGYCIKSLEIIEHREILAFDAGKETERLE